MNLNFHPFDVVFNYRDPQLQVGENYTYQFHINYNSYWFNINLYHKTGRWYDKKVLKMITVVLYYIVLIA